MSVTKLERNAQNKFVCPTCGQELKYVEGQAVQLVGGRADMDSILPKHECHNCGVFYRELLGSGFYDVFPLPKPPKKILRPRFLKYTALSSVPYI